MTQKEYRDWIKNSPKQLGSWICEHCDEPSHSTRTEGI